jgi:hypothetical protein
MPESYRTNSLVKTKPLWQIYYPDRDLSSMYIILFLETIIILFNQRKTCST